MNGTKSKRWKPVTDKKLNKLKTIEFKQERKLNSI